ncbi:MULTISPECIES: hypothetical protein [Vibrio harveyi group]|uniref:Uncharacterized protein n=1 Tax=Vibrio owensii CAIM 1854 = LMG 25443 TaxID=1229493 RepID=A0A0C1ZJS9_9VIBR|nr:hypothetical protein [Vibrio owensii]KIF53431.1 hypothetical protein H735_11000 [Vibrio owensii CAIM 1854 = LMG 25443]
MTETTKVLHLGSLVEQGNNQIAEIKREQNAPVTATARNIGFVAFSLVGVILAGFIALQIITGTLALLVGVGGMALMFYALRYLKMNDKHIKQKMRNRVIANMIEEAKTRKIETLTNLVIDSQTRLDGARAARDKMGGYVNKVKSKLAETDKSSSHYTRMCQMAEKVEKAYELVQQSVERAGHAHKNLSLKVKEYKDMAEFSEIVNDAMSFAKSEKDSLENMLGMEAFAAIDQDFQEAMVTIENSVADYELDND